MPSFPGGRAGARNLACRVAVLVLVLTAIASPAHHAVADARPPARSAPRTGESSDPAARQLHELTAELERDHASPRALVPLVELAGLESEVPDLVPLARAYARLADDGAAHPEVRALARFRLAHLERSRGNLQRADAEIARLAFIEPWHIAGPFDNDAKRGFDAIFPPELGQDLSARFPGKERQVGWRPLPAEATRLGFMHVGAAVRPARDVVVYALAVVESPATRRVQLHLGASGALKVFVNGAVVHADPAYHVARLDQAVVAVTLRKGANRILVKLCHAEGRLGFYARLTDTRGEPLWLPRGELAATAGVTPSREQPPHPRAPGTAGTRADAAEPVPGVLAALERATRDARGPAAASAQYDLAIAVAERRSSDDRERRHLVEARRAAELAPGSARAQLLAARLEDDANRRRSHVEAALAAHPDDARVLVALARLEMQRSRLVAARRLLDRAVAAAPAFVEARLALADLWEQAGLAARAGAQREAIARANPLHHAAVAAAARSARALDRVDEATQLLRKALALRYDDATSRATLIQLLVDRADLDGAVRLLEESIRLAPADVDARLRLADLLAGNGRRDEAEAAFAEALRIAPEEPEIHERRGHARLRSARSAEALRDFTAALDLRPQNPQLKELVRAIEPARERFERPYVADLRELARLAPVPPPDDADAVVLGDLKVTRVFPSGLASRYTQVVVKVLTQRGVDAWRSWSAGYSPDRQELRVDRARILKPDGSMVESFQESDRSASEPWYRLYYDARTRQLTFPALAPGDVLEIAVRTDDVASENLLADYFGELVLLADGTPKLRTDYVLLMPEGRRIFANDPALPGTRRSERSLPGGVVEHRWTARDVDRIRPEPGMPGWSEVAPYVHVSTYRSWDEVARFYWALVREQLTPTPELRAVALRLAADVRAERRERGDPVSGDELAVVKAVHRFVVTNTRYVGLEFGIHGFKPYRVDQVLDRRFGDCKDKASLTHALLEALGIDSRLVLLRMRRLGTIVEQPASLAVFNHAILYVPRHDLWLDGTASYSGSRDLPAEDRGATVLVVNPGDAPRFGTVPEGEAEHSVTATRYDVTLRADGSALVTGEARVSGLPAPTWRRTYAADAERRIRLEQAMARTFPEATVKEIAVSDLGRLEDDVTVRFSLAVPRLAEHRGDQLRLLPFGTNHRYGEALAPLSARHYDLVLGPPSETRLTYRYVLPPGFVPSLTPEPVHLRTAFAELDVSYRVEAGALVAEARLALKAGRIAAAEYPAFRELVEQIDRALADPVRLAPRAGPGAALEHG